MSSWTPPEALNQALPRRIATKRSLWSAFLLNGVITALLLYAAWTLLSSNLRDDEIRTAGIRGTGTIVGLHTELGRSTTYSVDYSYQLPANGEAQPSPIYHATGTTNLSIYNRLAVGQSVPIAYDPSHPTVSRLNFGDLAFRPGPSLLFTILLSAGSLLIVFLGPFFIIVAYRNEKWLLQWGQAAEATIVREYQYSAGRSGKRTAIVYRFTDGMGQTVEGTRKGLPAKLDHAKYRDIFDNPTALFDSQRSKRNKLYPMVYVTCLSPGDKTANLNRP